MAALVVLCTDGSEASVAGLQGALGVLGSDIEPVVVMVTEPPDPSLLTGTGMAGGTISPETYTQIHDERAAEAASVVATVAATLGLAGARTEVLEGRPGPSLCTFAEGEGAAAIAIGSRGHGGLRRAVLGSVSDHVVRHAPCPVIVARPPGG